MRIYLADLAHDFCVDDESLTIPLNIGYVNTLSKVLNTQSVVLRDLSCSVSATTDLHPPKIGYRVA